MKGKIVAIGGGEIGRPGYSIETEEIDREIISLTGKKHPKALLVPTASGDSDGYFEVFKKYYGKRLGCKTEVLPLVNSKYSKRKIRELILESDIIYVGGGNTKMMLEVWKKRGVDKILKEALEKGVILSGVSAGAICWFEYGNSDSLRFETGEKELIKLKGLGFVEGMACPHFNFEKMRRPSLRKMISKEGGMALALDNCSALEIVDGEYRVLTSSKNANVYLLYKKGNRVVEEKVPRSNNFRPLEELLNK